MSRATCFKCKEIFVSKYVRCETVLLTVCNNNFLKRELIEIKLVKMLSCCRYLYWNDQGSKQIERSRLDGSAREVLVNSSHAHLPNQMALSSWTR